MAVHGAHFQPHAIVFGGMGNQLSLTLTVYKFNGEHRCALLLPVSAIFDCDHWYGAPLLRPLPSKLACPSCTKRGIGDFSNSLRDDQSNSSPTDYVYERTSTSTRAYYIQTPASACASVHKQWGHVDSGKNHNCSRAGQHAAARNWSCRPGWGCAPKVKSSQLNETALDLREFRETPGAGRYPPNRFRSLRTFREPKN